jgi:lia operon protein LiaF
MKSILRYFLAIFLIGLGIMLVLTNLGMVNFDFYTVWGYIYPIFFLVLGVKWVIDYFNRGEGSWIFGSFLIIFGGLLLLDRFELIVFSFGDVINLWPLLIIYAGFLLIGKKRTFVHVSSGNEKKNKKQRDSYFSFGNQEFNHQNWKVEPMNLSQMAGDFYFDFTKAFIPDKEIPISIQSLAGDVNIVMPENIDFRVKASVKAGEVYVAGQTVEGINRSLQYETNNYDTAVRKIDFQIHLKAGSIRIDYV